MRVTAGTLKGRELRVPRGLDVRPTPAKVRAAIFNILGDAVVDARVLDLYAGAGSLGIEALSRGAAHVVFVDSSRAALRNIAHNLETLGVAERATVVGRELPGQLKGLVGGPFDLVFSDPPYAGNPLEALAAGLVREGLVRLGTMWVHEAAARRTRLAGESADLAGWEGASPRIYGDTAIWLWRARTP